MSYGALVLQSSITVTPASVTPVTLLATVNGTNASGRESALPITSAVNVQPGDMIVVLIGNGYAGQNTAPAGMSVSDTDGNAFATSTVYTDNTVYNWAYYATAKAAHANYGLTVSMSPASYTDAQMYLLRGVTKLAATVGAAAKYQAGNVVLPNLPVSNGIVLVAGSDYYDDITVGVQSGYTTDSSANAWGNTTFAHKMITASGTESITLVNSNGNERIGGIALCFTP